MTADALPLHRYPDLHWRKLEHAYRRDGAVQVLLSKERAEALSALIAMQRRIDEMKTLQVSPPEKARAVLSAAWLVVRLSVKHRQLFEVQRLAFVLAPSHEVKALNDNEVLFRFSP